MTDKIFYRKRRKIENLLTRLKECHRIATRYDRCTHTFFSTICAAPER
ncbi:hypothetical protein GCM10028812_53690 [Ancylobacter sonchi]